MVSGWSDGMHCHTFLAHHKRLHYLRVCGATFEDPGPLASSTQPNYLLTYTATWSFCVIILLAICHYSGYTVVSGVLVGICNQSQKRTSKCTCLIFGVSIGLDPG